MVGLPSHALRLFRELFSIIELAITAADFQRQLVGLASYGLTFGRNAQNPTPFSPLFLQIDRTSAHAWRCRLRTALKVQVAATDDKKFGELVAWARRHMRHDIPPAEAFAEFSKTPEYTERWKKTRDPLIEPEQDHGLKKPPSLRRAAKDPFGKN